MSTNRLREIAPLVRDAGIKISQELGYQGAKYRPLAAERASVRAERKVRRERPVSRRKIAAK